MSKHDKKKPSEEAASKFRSAAKKGVSFFKTAKAALKGDEAAKEQLTEAASTAMVKFQDKAEQTGKSLGDIADKIEKKIEEKRTKPAAPTP